MRLRDRRRRGISRPADPSHRAPGRRQRHRHGRAHPRRGAGEQIGQQIIVDDRPGGALTVGLDLTAKAAPDGYTICMGPIGALAITRHLVANLPYVIERDFQPIVVVAKGHLLLAVSPTTPFQTVTELVAYAKQNPGKLSNASSSNGSPGHVGGELFKFMTGTESCMCPTRAARRRSTT